MTVHTTDVSACKTAAKELVRAKVFVLQLTPMANGDEGKERRRDSLLLAITDW